MHELKAKFLEGIDGLISLSEGSGTLEELFEAITLKRLGQFTQPIVILNTRGFYESLRHMLGLCIRERFMHPQHEERWPMVEQPEEVLPAIKNAPKWDQYAIKFATYR